MTPAPTGFRTVLVTASSLALALFSTSCADQETAEPESNMNQTQAEERIEEYIDHAAAELPGDVELSSEGDPAFPACEGEPGEENHKVNVRHIFWVDGIPEEQNEDIAESLYSYWNTGNWKVTKDERPEGSRIEARNRADDFSMDLIVDQDGRPSLAAYSPCVHADDNL